MSIAYVALALSAVSSTVAPSRRRIRLDPPPCSGSSPRRAKFRSA
ncbi:hypothetical protein [Streptomyces sp. ISL-43]|nr:hypothetical protein [Streptomyces sp. ISL-43]